MKTQLFIAAGGKGKRLGKLTQNIPKSLVNIYGKPIIDHIIKCGLDANIDQIVIGIDDNKAEIERHVKRMPVCVEGKCIEPLTEVFFRSIQKYGSDISFGVNGDTVYKPSILQKAIDMLNDDTSAAAVVMLTNAVRPVRTSDWIYWCHHFCDGVMVSMDEVPGCQISTEYIVSAYRTSAIRDLSDDFQQYFNKPSDLPFHSYSLGWDYLLRILLWKKFKVIGMICDDLSLNINHQRDLDDGKYFFTDPEFFRYLKTKPHK